MCEFVIHWWTWVFQNARENKSLPLYVSNDRNMLLALVTILRPRSVQRTLPSGLSVRKLFLRQIWFEITVWVENIKFSHIPCLTTSVHIGLLPLIARLSCQLICLLSPDFQKPFWKKVWRQTSPTYQNRQQKNFWPQWYDIIISSTTFKTSPWCKFAIAVETQQLIAPSRGHVVVDYHLHRWVSVKWNDMPVRCIEEEEQNKIHNVKASSCMSNCFKCELYCTSISGIAWLHIQDVDV